MNDLVSRQAAYDTLTEYYHHRTETQHKSLKEALSRVPPIDVPDRKVGQWLNGTYRQICSICRYKGYRSWKYCPNCGARMERSEE